MWTGGWYGGWDGDWFGDEEVGGSSASLSATGGSGTFAGTASSPATVSLDATGGSGAFSGTAFSSAVASLGVVGGSGAFSGSASSGATVDVRVSWLAFDTAATPYDVRVSWLAFDTSASQVPAVIPKNGGISRTRSMDWLLDKEDDEIHRITSQNNMILALVAAAVSQGLLA